MFTTANKIFVKLNKEIKFDKIALIRNNNSIQSPIHNKKPPLILKPQIYSISNDINTKELLFSMLKSTPPHFSSTTEQQKFIRNSLIQHIKVFIFHYKYNPKILLNTIFLFDYLISKIGNTMTYEKIGAGATILSIKFNANENSMISIKRFQYLYSDIVISQKELLLIEIICLQNIDYFLSMNSPNNFLDILLSNGIVFNADISNSHKEINGNIYSLPLQILEKIMTNNRGYTLYHPFHLACSCVALAREINGVDKWPSSLSRGYTMPFEEIASCFYFIKSVYQESPMYTQITPKKSKYNSCSPVKRVIQREDDDLVIKETKKYDIEEVITSRDLGNVRINLKEEFLRSEVKNPSSYRHNLLFGHYNNIKVNTRNNIVNNSTIVTNNGGISTKRGNLCYNGVLRNHNYHSKTKSMDMSSIDSYTNNTLASTLDNINIHSNQPIKETASSRKPNIKLGNIMKGITRAKVINVYQKQKGGVIDFNNTSGNYMKKVRESNSMGKGYYKNKNLLNLNFKALPNFYLNQSNLIKKERNQSVTVTGREEN